MDTEMREKIVRKATEAEIRHLSRANGYGGLLDSGVNKMLLGLTTAEEVLRVTFTEDKSIKPETNKEKPEAKTD